jgi:hypothetical protein
VARAWAAIIGNTVLVENAVSCGEYRFLHRVGNSESRQGSEDERELHGD